MEKLIIAIAILCALVGFWKFITRRDPVDPYEWLEFLDYENWKSGRDLRKEMELHKGGDVTISRVYFDMGHLEAEGLAEHRDSVDEDGRIIEFRRKRGGRKVKKKKPLKVLSWKPRFSF